MTGLPPLPPADPGLRLSLLRGFHAVLCLRSSDGPERHRPEGGSERRLPAACWRALAVVDVRAGDLDEVLLDLRQRTADTEREIAASRARVAAVEQAVGLRPPAIEGEVLA